MRKRQDVKLFSLLKWKKMLLRIILGCLLHVSLWQRGACAQGVPVLIESNHPEGYVPDDVTAQSRCLTGYMTDVQEWVDQYGFLTSAVDKENTIDLSAMVDVVPTLYQQIQLFRSGQERVVKYLSMAKCELNRVPTVFQLRDTRGRLLADTLQFVTFYGNRFLDISSPGEQYDMILNATKAKPMDVQFGFSKTATSAWSTGFQQVVFSHLRQLDLRRCNIQILSDNIFKGMPKLEALFLGENLIAQIGSNAFSGLKNLIHLDLSRNLRNNDIDIITFESSKTFSELKKLESLDMSFSKMARKNIHNFETLGKQFQRLSLCYTGLARLSDFIFNDTSLRYLDVSGNNGILTGYNVLGGTEDTLQVLYADEIGLKTMEIFFKFNQLEILKITNNEISLLTPKTAKSLTRLQVLDLTNNRMNTWFTPTLHSLTDLQFLSLRDNNINIISVEMITDFENISYVGLSGNFFICNCHTRELFELALRNEFLMQHGLLQPQSKQYASNNFAFHTGFEDFNNIIKQRKNVTRVCRGLMDDCEDVKEELESDGNFLLIDYDAGIYQCLVVGEGKTVPFSSVQTCQQTKRDIDLDEVIDNSWNKLLALIIIPAVTFPVLIFAFVFRRNFKYCFITMRNSTLLSLINKKDTIDDETIFNYDVFVSYCNDDRNWVLDHLLPHVEKDCNVSVCLHERDFQVGLSILENIVSCMDRSRSIMLVISKKFLLSQWCQFEMHLAQHRLLETRREDLILILLEDIPRRLRPTTLHYLMLTKTYIVWPKDSSDQPVFWRRLKKSLMTYRLKQAENSSLA